MPKIEFLPGCFDDFEGTQEELDEMIATIKEMAENGTLIENSVPLDGEALEDFLAEVEEDGLEIVFTPDDRILN